jgi:hypothetical protein
VNKYHVVLPLLFLLVGCQTAPVSKLSANAAPSWVVSPERSGFISVVGYAPQQPDGNESAQYKVALMKARQELAQMVRVRIQNKTEQTLIDDNGKVSSTGNSATQLSTKAAIRMNAAEVNAQWIDDKGGLYLLLERPE